MLSELVLASLVASTWASAPVLIPIKGYRTNNPVFARHEDLAKRAVEQQLENRLSYYRATLQIGTPPQDVEFTIDTGSSDLWVMSAENPLCATSDSQITSYERPNCSAPIVFHEEESSTFEGNTSWPFSIFYGDTSAAQGYYATDVVRIGNATLDNQIFAFANVSNATTCVFGIGPVGGVASSHSSTSDSSTGTLAQSNTTIVNRTYANVPEGMKEQGVISRNAYSVWLNDINALEGSILYGGIDHAKYVGNLYTVPMVTTRGYVDGAGKPILPFVTLNGVSAYTSNGKAGQIASGSMPILLDTGSTIAYLPTVILNSIVSVLQASYASSIEAYYCLCKPRSVAGLEFDFSGAKIYAPIDQLLLPLYTRTGAVFTDNSGNALCELALRASTNVYILGDIFLRSAYVVFDNDNFEVSIANTRFNTTDTNIEEIQNSVPSASPAPSASTTSSVRAYMSSVSYTATSDITTPAGSTAGKKNDGGILMPSGLFTSVAMALFAFL